MATLLVLVACSSASIASADDARPVANVEEASVLVEALVELIDLTSLEVSADGLKFAISTRRAVVAENSYEQSWHVLNLASDDGPRYVDDAGEPMLEIRSSRMFPSGSLETPTSKWSPDGRYLAYTKFVSDNVELWIARPGTDGFMKTEQVSPHGQSTVSFFWTNDSSALHYTVGPPVLELQQQRERDYRRGYRLSDIAYPLRSLSPFYDRKRIDERRVYSTLTGEDREDEQIVPPVKNTSQDRWSVVSNNGSSAYVKSESNAWWASRGTLFWASALNESSPVACRYDECRGYISNTWWNSDGEEIIFSRREGINHASFGLYGWRPQYDSVRTILRSDDKFSNCNLGNDILYCVKESPIVPNQIVSIDVKTGDLTILFSPNRDFHDLPIGFVERLEWDVPDERPDFGYHGQSFGYIIYPPDYDDALTYPAIIAPYRAAGFQRGDQGDEQPLFLYAASGFVVLNLEQPDPWGVVNRASTVTELMDTLYDEKQEFPDLSFKIRTIERLVQELVDRGTIDADKIGMGGLSNGAQMTAFALHRFPHLASAASISSSTWDPILYYFSQGTDTERSWALPSPDESIRRKFWSGLSMALNADKVRAPVIMNIPDTEYIDKVQVIRALNDLALPHEVFIYPDEYHVKWQPAHRFYIYRRNLQWFQFWLQGVEADDPVDRDQYERWREMRDKYCLEAGKQSEEKLPTFCSHR